MARHVISSVSASWYLWSRVRLVGGPELAAGPVRAGYGAGRVDVSVDILRRLRDGILY